VVVAEAAVAAHEQPAVECLGDRIDVRERGHLGGAELAAGDRGQLGQAARVGRERGGRRADRGTQPGRRPVGAVAHGAGGLDRQQRVAVGDRDDLVDARVVERSEGAHEPAHLAVCERRELDLHHRDVPGADGLHERIDVLVAGERPAREDEQHAVGADPARDVRRELEARGVGGVDVLEQQRDRRRALDELDRRLEQPRALELRGARGAGGVRGAAEPLRQRGHEAGELLRPGHALGRQREPVGEVADQLGP
jgi:hypothetical protein